MFFAIEEVLLGIFFIALLALPAAAIIHLLKNEIRGRNKLIWILVIIFLPFFGSILYFLMGKKYREVNR